MKLLNFDRVLCLSPHPDDVEISMTGTVIKFNETKFDIYCLTYGTPSDQTSNLNRIIEVESFWKAINLENVNLITPKNNFVLRLMTEDEWITQIEKEVLNTGQFKHDAIFGPTIDDSHFEHRIVNSFMEALGRKTPLSIVEYKTPSTLDSWETNMYVDISESYHRKINMLNEHFKSQTDSLYFRPQCLEAFHTQYSSIKRGIRQIEQFKIKTIYE